MGLELIADRPLDLRDLQLYDEYTCALAEWDFWAFRQWLDPDIKHSWWQRDAAGHMQQFYYDYKAGKRPKLVLQAPPQHGKSRTMIEFSAWLAGKEPNNKTIFASYSEDLGKTANLQLQRIFTNLRYGMVFPNTKIGDENVVTRNDRYLRNASIMEFVRHKGSFRNTTVEGQINGMGLDFGLIDDPLKGRAEAQSLVTRNKTWQWFTDDFFGRFSEHAGLVMIMTRWHVDDTIGRFVEQFPETKVLRYPAIAEHDEEFRRKGEPLFPEHKSLDFLLERKKLLTQASWESVYQQNPIVVGGGIFPIEKIGTLPVFDRSKIKRSVRYVDKAGTEDGGAYTAAVLMHALSDGTYVVEHVARGQWGAGEREARIKQLAENDKAICKNYQVWVEQEPGSGGKESAESTIRNLTGFAVFADKVTGSKEIRAEPYAAQVQGGNVRVVAGEWVLSYFDELECVVGDTQVYTCKGNRPIKDVRVGDLVMTRAGWRRVLQAGCTSEKARICEVQFSGRGRLRCTLNHPILVRGSGFMNAGSLTAGNTLLHFTEASNIGFAPMPGTSGLSLTWKDFSSIAQSMRMKLAKCQTVITSITRMAIRTITWLQTLSVCLLPNTCGRLALATTSSNALVVERNSAVKCPTESIVRNNAPESTAQNGHDQKLNVRARSARKNLTSATTSLMSIFSAAFNVQERVGGHAVQSVQVERVVLLPGEHAVYNLEVEEAHEYVANGVLVHNCFPSGKYRDQVDASTGAFNKLTGTPSYNLDAMQ